MAVFESSQFKTSVPSTQMREFNVGAPEDVPQAIPPQTRSASDIEQSMREARAAKQAEINNGQRLTSGAKKRIELLADIGRLTRDVKVGGYVFSLRTLKAKETREAAIAAFSSVETQLEASYEVRRHQLARSIFQIDSHSTDEVIEAMSLEDKLVWLDGLEEILVSKLFSEFNSLKEEAQVKYGITSAEQAKEVIEDLKK